MITLNSAPWRQGADLRERGTKMPKQYYIFQVPIGGYGESAEEAWQDACENFDLDEAVAEQPQTYSIDPEVEEDHE